ncbi:FAD-dependent monooxygenase [Nocardia mexicana]|uniref:2-polyprenyl-6-methoxyphenol hydroxylase-like FAD-dependent oxidoreductase n=1 Tax=Nocardia mexicana TaxID=279262 RepID=A0A370H2C9_9NOCA|nr:FAD-dependent monooxygenase [Nocardia mexicana]RDI49768.1 2-polyprenyl-6-methoxyphenol hydroxylase-like FAD-dependent oxidoreductase [Nocardia mexicana]
MGATGRAIVVGGGIGGLATAIALTRRDWQVEVLERAAVAADAGSGLGLWPNGVRALDALTVGERVRARAMVDTDGGVRDLAGRWMSKTDTVELARRYGSMVTIHRADLFGILRDALPADTLRLGITVTGVENHGGRAKVVHSEGVSEADLVVGADGLRSRVRHAVWPQARGPRYAGYTTWRMVTHPVPPLRSGGETWGRGRRFGIVPLSDGRVYLYGTVNAPEGARGPDGEWGEVRRHFGTWHDPIPALLDAVDPEAVLRHDIYDLPDLPAFVHGRVALLGDAAHAMTPNVGQGANQALEDAVALAALLDRHPIEAALATYDRLRRPHTQAIVRRSRRVGAVAQWSWRPATMLRDTVVRRTPGKAGLRSLAPILDWGPPELTAE